MNQAGFTLKELVMVLVIIGIMCVAAVPQFFYLQNSQRQSQMETVLIQIQTKLKNQKGITYPESLDNHPTHSVCGDCFDAVLPKGVQSPLWYKVSSKEYLFSRNGNYDSVADFREEGDFKITYNQETGTLLKQQF